MGGVTPKWCWFCTVPELSMLPTKKGYIQRAQCVPIQVVVGFKFGHQTMRLRSRTGDRCESSIY